MQSLYPWNSQSPFFPFPQIPPVSGNHSYAFCLYRLFILDISYNWNRTTCGRLWLVSFTHCNVLKIHLCWSMYQRCLPFYDGLVLHCVDAPHFLYPLIYWGTLVLLPPTLFKPFLTGSHPHQSTQTALSEITDDPHVAISHGWSQSSLDLHYQLPLACQSLSLLKSLLDWVGSTRFLQISPLPLWSVLSCLLYYLSPLF